MSLELLKIMVQPVILERDPDGRIVKENFPDPVTLYDLAKLHEFVEELERQIAAANENGTGR